MLGLALKGLVARKLRTALTGFAVVLGVAFIAGTFIFTDTIDASFKDLFERASKGVDVSVKASEAVDDDFNEAREFPASVLETVRATPGVEAAEGSIDGTATLFDKQGERIGGQTGPALLFSARQERVDPLSYDDGGPPRSDRQVTIDKATADDHDFAVGDRIRVAGGLPARSYTISGIARLGDTASLGGLGFVAMTLPEAQRVADNRGEFDEVVAAAQDDTSPAALKARISRELGAGYAVRTGQEEADRQATELGDQLGFIKTALLVFGGVSLFVGGFIIFNTFSITVAQRSREFALLRTIGASRRQILAAVVVEALIIGLLSSALGVLAGLVLAPALSSLLASFGLDLPQTETVVATRTIVVGLVVGTVVTVLAGLMPARRATRVDPVTALRESVTPTAVRVSRRRVAIALALTATGIAVLLAGLFASPGSASATAGLLGLGAVVTILGVAVLSPVLVRPLAGLLGRPLERLQGMPGRLARENAERQPQRTAVTAAALMVGLALVVFVSIFAAGTRASVDKVIDEQFKGQVVITNADDFTPLPAALEGPVSAAPDVAAVSPLLFQSGKVAAVPGNTAASGVDPRTFGQTLELNWTEGSPRTVAALTNRQTVVDESWAESHGKGVGTTVDVTTPTGERVPYRVVGTFDNQLGLFGNIIVSVESMRTDWNVRQDALVLVAGRSGASPEALKGQVEAALKPFPTAKTSTLEEYKDDQAEQVNQLLGLVFALLSLSVIVSLLGIVNTLALAVYERTRELGLLRAVGMSRRQVRRMVRSEAVITAGIGAILGLVLGTVFAAIVSRPLADDGFALAVPWGTLIILAVLAGVAGVVASIGPARRAARVDVLRAVTTE